MIICFIVPEIWCVTDVIVVFQFGLFFALPLNNSKNEKNAWRPGDTIILQMCPKNYD